MRIETITIDMEQWAVVPRVPSVSNEMKAKFIGDFEWQEDASYYDDDERCYVEYRATRIVPWDLCKTIFKQMAAHWIAAAPSPEPVQQEERRGLTAPMLRKLEAEYKRLRASADSEACSAIRFEIRVEALGFKRAMEMIGREPEEQPSQPISTDIDMDRMLYAYELLPDYVKRTLSIYALAELRKALNLTFIPTPDEAGTWLECGE